jgi:hypothetical protein
LKSRKIKGLTELLALNKLSYRCRKYELCKLLRVTVTVAELSVAAVSDAVSDASFSYHIINSAQLSSFYRIIRSAHAIASSDQACHIASSARLILPISSFISNKFGHKSIWIQRSACHHFCLFIYISPVE